MENPKVAIIDNDPKKLKRYQDAIEQMGGIVVRTATTEDEASELIRTFSADPDTTPDVVLTDALLNPDGYKRALEVWGWARERWDREGRPWRHPMPQTDGARITEQIRSLQAPEQRQYVEDNYDELAADPSIGSHPERLLISPDVKVIGISDGLGISGADVSNASPEQAVEYIRSL